MNKDELLKKLWELSEASSVPGILQAIEAGETPRLTVEIAKEISRAWAEMEDEVKSLRAELERTRDVLKRERGATYEMIAAFNAWGYRTAGQSLPGSLAEAISEFETKTLDTTHQVRTD